jgi:hypothetical protein
MLILQQNVDIAPPYNEVFDCSTLHTTMTLLSRHHTLVLAALLVALSFAKDVPSLDEDRGASTVGSMLQVLHYNHLFFMIDPVSSRFLPQRSLELESSGDYDAAMALLLQVLQPRQHLPGP